MISQKTYMGMICGFSDAERLGFEAALQLVFGISIKSYDLKKYTFCHIHFELSSCRITETILLCLLGAKMISKK
jgi:hypothetical protein